jgi:hypothetical protein
MALAGSHRFTGRILSRTSQRLAVLIRIYLVNPTNNFFDHRLSGRIVEEPDDFETLPPLD